MPGLSQYQPALALRTEARNRAPELVREIGLRKQQVEARDGFHGLVDIAGVTAQQLRQLSEDAVHFALFFLAQPHQLIIQIDGFERLDEQRVSATAGTMNDAV